MNSTTHLSGHSSGHSSGSSSGQLSGSRVQIRGLTRQGAVDGSGATLPSSGNRVQERRGFPFTLLELVVLAAGFGAFAALMTSCSSTRSKNSGDVTGSEPISTGLSSLLNSNAKSPKLNTPAEITKDSDYQQLANQAKLDYEALFSRDPKSAQASKSEPAPSSGLNSLKSPPPVIEIPEVQERSQEPAKPEVGHEVFQPVVTLVETSSNQQSADKEGSSNPVVATPVTAVPPLAASADATKPGAGGTLAAGGDVISVPEAALPVFKGSNALLASRVSGYGRYVPLPRRPGAGTFVFQSARSNRAIVYIEIENFGYRAAKEADPDKMPGDQWAVDLSTEMQLLDAYDGMLQVKEPERSVIETGRNKRKDFYLVQEIELPPTLTIGSYNLKIVLRDKSGSEAVRTEAIIPIQIVADLTAIVDER